MAVAHLEFISNLLEGEFLAETRGDDADGFAYQMYVVIGASFS